MTEATGGSDVGPVETVARLASGAWRLYGRKWFTSADHLADGADAGAARGQSGRRQGPGAVLRRDARRRGPAQRHLGQPPEGQARHAQGADGRADARRHAGAARRGHRRDGVKHIAPMLNVTRTWNSVCAPRALRGAASRWRATSPAKRVAFGAPLAEKPLAPATRWRDCEAEFVGAFHLTFLVVELLGRDGGGRGERGAERAAAAADAAREAHHRPAGRACRCRR